MLLRLERIEHLCELAGDLEVVGLQLDRAAHPARGWARWLAQ